MTNAEREELASRGVRLKPSRGTRAKKRRRVVRPIAARFGQVAIVAAVVMLLTFLLVHIVPGDPVLTLLGPRATPETVAAMRHQMHLDLPLAEQARLFISNTLQGDLGHSLLPGERPVSDIVFPALKVTLSVIACTVAISLVLGVMLGVLGGVTKRPALDGGIRSLLMVLLAMPPFLVGFLLLLLALHTRAAPPGGWGTGALDDLRYIWMPALALSAYLAPVIARSVRQSVREVLSEDFIEATTARGLPQRRIIWRHIVPNSLLPMITLVGYNIGALIGGAVVIEAVFNLPGIGSALVYAVNTRDYPVVQGTALVTAILVVFINAVADLTYQFIDPRTRPS